MFTFETARLDGGGEFTRKEKLFKRTFLRGPARRGGRGARAAGKGAPCLARAERGPASGGGGGGSTLSEPQFPSLDNKVVGFYKGPSAGRHSRSLFLSFVVLCASPGSEERDWPLGGGKGGALTSCGLPGRCHAFPALSLHSRASDVFWVSVGPPSQARSTFLDSPCSVRVGKVQGASAPQGQG